MMTSKHQQALQLLDRIIASSRLSGVSRLPTLAQMAAASGLSIPTLSKALTTLAARGVVTSRPGAGIRVCDTPARSTDAPERHGCPRTARRRSDEVAASLKESIFAGGLLTQPGESLTVKMVRSRFGVSYPVARDALARLEATGLVYRYARGYRRRRHHASAQPSSVALILRTRTPGAYFTLSPRMQRWLSIVQTESANVRIRLRIVPVSHRSRAHLPAARDLVHGTIRRGDTTPLLGCMVLADGFDDPYLTSLVAALDSARVSTAILGDISDTPIATTRVSPRLHFFAPAGNATAGRAVALALLEAGHRRIAFVTDALSAAWSSQRFDAAHGIVSEAGGTLTLVAPRMPHTATPGRQDVNREVRVLFSSLGHGGTHCFADVRRRDTDELTHAVLAMGRRLRIRPSYERAVRDLVAKGAVTAFVAAHDQLALECASMLADLGTPPPAGVSLASFDNSFAAALDGIASYDFNLAETVRQAIEWLLGPHHASSLPGNRPPVTYAQGFFADRGSVGDASSAM